MGKNKDIYLFIFKSNLNMFPQAMNSHNMGSNWRWWKVDDTAISFFCGLYLDIKTHIWSILTKV